MREFKSREDARAEGLRRYFTGAPCKNGHIAERRVANKTCIECERSISLKWYYGHPEKAKTAAKNFRCENPEYNRTWKRAAYAADPSPFHDQVKRYRLKHPEKVRASRREWSDRNRDAINARARAWRADNPGRRQAEWSNRRARKRAAAGSYTAADVTAILGAQSHKCAWCRVSLRRVKRHVDHIIPLAAGGSNFPSNIQVLCASCNLRKGAKDPILFAQENGRLL